jgi:multidrug transporter EmrE-like cation transporter
MFYILIALFAYSAATLVLTFANRHTSVSIVNLIVNGMSAVIPAILVATQWNNISKSAGSKQGLIASVVAGILISFFGLALGKAYATTNVAIVVPVVFGGSIVLSAIGSVVFFKEKIEPIQLIGLCLVVAGLGLVVYSRAR